MIATKPIRVFYSELSDRFYATQHYRERGDGQLEVTGKKWDVTDDIGHAVTHYGIEFVAMRDPSGR